MRRIHVIAAITVSLVVALAFNLSPYLRGPDSWRWAYAIPGQPLRHLVPAAVTIGYSAVVALVWRRFRVAAPSATATRAFLWFTAAAAALIQLALLYPESPDVLRPLLYRTVSPGASGVFTVGSRIGDLGAFLRAYPDLMPGFPVHPQRYPPGLPVLFYLTRQTLARAPGLADRLGMALRPYQCHDLELMLLPNVTLATTALQMALPILAGLIVFPLHQLAKHTVEDRAALLAVGLYPLVPSLALWSARWDQAYPLLTCLIWVAFTLGLTRNRWEWMLAAGLCLGAASFLSFALVALLVPLGLWALLWPLSRNSGWRGLWDSIRSPYIPLGAAFVAGLAAPWLVYQLAFGSGFFDIWRVSMSFHLGLARDYWVWFGYHLYDFLLFLGIPIAVLFIFAVADIRRRQSARANAFSLAVGLSLALLNVAGVAQGEVARVWLFLTPLFVVTAAQALVETDDKAPQRRCCKPVGVVMALLALQLLTFNAVLRVVTTGVSDPPIRAPQYASAPTDHTVQAMLDGELALLGYTAAPTVTPGQALTLTLTWKALGPIPHSYTVFTHLISPDGQLVAQHDGLPQRGQAPTTCWAPGEILTDTYILQIPADATPGHHTLYTGLYRFETGERLSLRGDAVTPEKTVQLGVVELAAP